MKKLLLKLIQFNTEPYKGYKINVKDVNILAKEGRINISYVVNQNEFNQSIQSMKKNVGLLESQLKTSATEMKNAGNNVQAYSKHISNLQQTIKANEKLMEKYNQSLKDNSEKLEKNQNKLKDLATQKEKLNAELLKATNIYGKESNEIKDLEEQMEKLDRSYTKTEKAIEANKKAIQSNLSEIEKCKTKHAQLSNELKDTTKALEEQSNAFVQNAKSFKKLSDKLDDMGGKLSDCGDTAIEMGGLIAGAVTALVNMGSETESALATIEGRLGTTKAESEQLQQVARNVYKNGFGESLSDTIDDLVSVEQNLTGVGELTQTETEKLLTHMSTIKELFGAESDELTRAMNSMMQNGLVSSYEEAMDLITKGFQEGANVSNEFLDSLNEYAPKFAELGLTAEDSIAMMINAVDNGAWSVDKVGDAIKENSIIIKEADEDTSTALGNLGLNSAEIFKAYGEGGESAKNAFMKIINGLESVEDPIARNQLGVELFGTMFEDLGEDAILSLNDIQDGLGNFEGSTEEAGRVLEDTFEHKIKVSVRELKDNLSKIGEACLPVFEKLIDGVGDFADIISNLNPDLVVSIAKFAGLSIAVGGTLKVIGGIASTMSKGASAIGGLMKIIGDTKSLGSFSKALAESDTSIGKLTTSCQGLSKVFSGFGLTGGLIAGAIAGVTALGIAFYNNQKEIEASEKKLQEMEGCYDDFTGRLRTNESIWSKIFGNILPLIIAI